MRPALQRATATNSMTWILAKAAIVAALGAGLWISGPPPPFEGVFGIEPAHAAKAPRKATRRVKSPRRYRRPVAPRQAAPARPPQDAGVENGSGTPGFTLSYWNPPYPVARVALGYDPLRIVYPRPTIKAPPTAAPPPAWRSIAAVGAIGLLFIAACIGILLAGYRKERAPIERSRNVTILKFRGRQRRFG